MKVKPWALFRADLPDDQVEKHHDIVVYGGRNVALALGEIFTSLGCEVAKPYSLEEQGWEFLVSDRGRNKFSCRVCSFHPAFRLLFEEVSLVPKVFRNRAAYADLARSLAAALEDDSRFHDITWWTWEEGPPEPDEISSVPSNPTWDEGSSGAIKPTKYVRRGSGYGWFTLAFLIFAVAALALRAWLWNAGLPLEEKEQELKFALVALGIGTLALGAGFRRRAGR